MPKKYAMPSVAVAFAALIAGVTAAQARPSFRPLHERIAFTSNRTGQNEIVVADADGSDRVDLNAPGRSPEFSPDGRKIAFSSTRDGVSQIYVMNADGSGQTRLTFDTSNDTRPHWAGDGRKIVFSRFFSDGNADIIRMNADGSREVDLTADPALEWGQSTRDDKVVFTREENGAGHIFLMNIDGRGLRRLTNGALYDSFPDLSPRGDLVLFVRDTADGTGDDIWVTRADGRGERQLTQQSATGYIVEPTWSPDGTRIMYSQCGPGGSDPCTLHVMNTDGSRDHDISTPQVPYLDAFEGSQIGSFWTTNLQGSGPSLAETNGRLEITLPAGTTSDPSLGYSDFGVFMQCRLLGDFDVQTDYQLLEWPAANVNLDFDAAEFDSSGAYIGGNGLFIFDTGSGNGISSNFPGLANAFAPYPLLSGTVRLTRVGDTLTASYLNNGVWVDLLSGSFAPYSAAMSLDVFSNAQPFSHEEVKVAYDNFRVNSGALSCPSWWSDNFADWAPLRTDR